jgi:hypothetical protein
MSGTVARDPTAVLFNAQLMSDHKDESRFDTVASKRNPNYFAVGQKG